ncbi:MAG: hypothetical protein WCR42_12085, partial [bacterium]
NYINFPFSYLDVNDSLILYCGGNLLGLAKKSVVSVIDIPIQTENNLRYQNYQLEYFSDAAFIGESTIYDTTGKRITIPGSQQFVIGENIIRVNQTLPNRNLHTYNNE